MGVEKKTVENNLFYTCDDGIEKEYS